jgi:hypothetical protein
MSSSRVLDPGYLGGSIGAKAAELVSDIEVNRYICIMAALLTIFVLGPVEL